MYTDIIGLGSGSLGTVDKDENGYIYTTSPSDPSLKYANHKWTTVTIPYAGMTKFGLSWMICYEDSDGVKHYPYGDSDRAPNTITSYWFVDPRDGHCFYGRNAYYFTASMVDAPTLDKNNAKWTPPTYPDDYSGVRLTTPPPTVEVYIQYGSAARVIYNTREDAIKYDQYGNFNGTNYYIDETYCKIIYEYDYFVQIENDELRTLDMPEDVPTLYETSFPDMIWRMDGYTNNGMIYSPLIPGMIALGAFKDVQTLRRVVIPKSCKKIGLVSFFGTNLREVTVPSDCSYAQTSFPDGCVVNFYPD